MVKKGSDSDLEWEHALRAMADGLVAVGEAYGDDPDLMRAKAQRAYTLLRLITEHLPGRPTHIDLGAQLTPHQYRKVADQLRKARDAGRDAALIHVAGVLTAALYDLCTSVLAPERRRD